jgi:hypothetical protein
MDVRTQMRCAAQCPREPRDLGYEDWLARQFAVDPDPAINPEDYFIVRHTGGTTGKSKAWPTPIAPGRRAQRHGREVRSGLPARVGAFTCA